jgi:prepilin-type N-terminal cleavage/methylation domain-containing protein
MKKNTGSVPIARSAFTLIELLVVIAIIGALSGMFALAYRGAQVESNSQKTQSTVEKISGVLGECLEEYTSEPIGVDYPSGWYAERDIPTPPNLSLPSKSRLIQQTNLLLSRDRLRYEMPDCPDDLKWTRSKAILNGRVTTPDSHIKNTYLAFRSVIPCGLHIGRNGPLATVSTPLSARAMRLMRKLSVLDNGVFVPIDGWETSNANAELLYLIVEDATFDGSSALEVFGKSEVGDTDNDGLSEFVDAFGNPIRWIRWPSGFEGIIFSHPDPLDPTLIKNGRLAIGDEPYDSSNADVGWVAGSNFKPEPLGSPLVVSAGLDKEFGLLFPEDRVLAPIDSRFADSTSVADARWSSRLGNVSTHFPIGANHPDPWYPRDNPMLRAGAITAPKAASDNLTNLRGTGASL